MASSSQSTNCPRLSWRTGRTKTRPLTIVPQPMIPPQVGDQRFLAMEKKLKAKDDEVKDLKDRVLEAVL